MTERISASKVKRSATVALNFLEKHLPALVLLVMVIVFITQIIARYFFRALPWPEELVGFLFLWLVCFGVGFAERDEGLIRFEMIHDAMGTRNKLRMNVLGDLLVIFALGVLFWPALSYVIDMNYRASDVMRINMSIVYAPFMILLTGLIVRSVLRLRRDIIVLRTTTQGPQT